LTDSLSLRPPEKGSVDNGNLSLHGTPEQIKICGLCAVPIHQILNPESWSHGWLCWLLYRQLCCEYRVLTGIGADVADPSLCKSATETGWSISALLLMLLASPPSGVLVNGKVSS